jgi:hypothetical protein
MSSLRCASVNRRIEQHCVALAVTAVEHGSAFEQHRRTLAQPQAFEQYERLASE